MAASWGFSLNGILYVENWNMLLFWSLTTVTEVLSVVLVPVSDNTYRVLQQLLKCCL
jgi:hypothetical protein